MSVRRVRGVPYQHLRWWRARGVMRTTRQVVVGGRNVLQLCKGAKEIRLVDEVRFTVEKCRLALAGNSGFRKFEAGVEKSQNGLSTAPRPQSGHHLQTGTGLDARLAMASYVHCCLVSNQAGLSGLRPLMRSGARSSHQLWPCNIIPRPPGYHPRTKPALPSLLAMRSL